MDILLGRIDYRLQLPKGILMPDDESFRTLLCRVRAGDQEAAAKIVRQYEEAIRRAVRLRLTDPRLRQELDSMDICQSILANFFVRAAVGQFDLADPGQLLKLLTTMVRNKIINHGRRIRAQRRDRRRLQAGGSDALDFVADSGESPSQIVAGRELLDEARRRLSPEERYLAEQRGLGRPWDELGAELGKSPEALRKQLQRAIDRVAAELGFEDGTND